MLKILCEFRQLVSSTARCHVFLFPLMKLILEGLCRLFIVIGIYADYRIKPRIPCWEYGTACFAIEAR